MTRKIIKLKIYINKKIYKVYKLNIFKYFYIKRDICIIYQLGFL